jgi:hypothetical protein
MAVPDPRVPGTETNTENIQDVIPPTERNKDPARSELTHGLTLESSRPLTDEERKAADRDAPVGQRVYAPASERVPVDPVPGHRDFVEHPDTHTPEREAAGSQSTESSEPTFARVARPSTTPTPGPYTSSMTNPGWNAANTNASWGSGSQGNRGLGMSMGWLTLGICSGLGVWLWLRWKRERNRPINRLRRQAKQAADEIRERVPSPEEAVQPAVGLSTAVLSILLLLWQQTRARSRATTKAARRATETVSDVDWQKRLTKLKDRWTPRRLELEKISIPRR